MAKEIAGYPGKAGFLFLGFLGEEARAETTPAQRAALGELLHTYQTFQQDDKQLRQLVVTGRQSQAIVHTMGPLSNNFETYDRALVKLTDLHRQAFDAAVGDGDRALGGWNLLLPIAALVAAALVLAGVGPRLSEYR